MNYWLIPTEMVGFEPTHGLCARLPVFETSPFSHLGTSPKKNLNIRTSEKGEN